MNFSGQCVLRRRESHVDTGIASVVSEYCHSCICLEWSFKLYAQDKSGELEGILREIK